MVLMVDRRIVYAGVAVGGAGIAFYLYQKNKKNKAAVTAAQQQSGYGYGMPGYGYGQTYSPYGYGYGPFGLGAYGGQGQFGYGYYGAGVPSPVPMQASTNAQWSEAAVSALTAVGYDGQAVLAALGVYLQGGNLTQDQTTIVQAAIAAEGYPPVPGPNNFPPQLHTGGGGGSGQGGGGVTTPGHPNIGGGDGGDGGTRIAGNVSGLSATSTKTTITATWGKSFAPDGYSYVVRDLGSHSQVAKGTTTNNRVTVRGLKSGTDYNFGIQGLPGGQGDNIHVRTK